MASKDDLCLVPRWYMERVDRVLSLVESFRMTGEVDFTKTETTMSAAVRPGRGGGGDEALVTLTAAGDADGLYKATEIWRDPEADSGWALLPAGRVFDGSAGKLPQVRELAGRTGLEAAAGEFAPALVRVTRTKAAPPGPAVEWVFSAGGAGVAWAKVVSVDGNEVTATPCDAGGTVADPAPANVTLWLFTPHAVLPTAPTAMPAAEDVLAYLPASIDDGVNTADGVVINWNPLPDGSGQYKGLFLDASGEPHWDYVRIH